MSHRAVTVILFHRSSKSDGTLDCGGQSAGISTAECLKDLARAEDDESRHTERGD